MKQASAPPLYPPLDEERVDHSYRLQEISRLRTHLVEESEKRAQLYKKYRRGINAIDGVDTVLLTVSIGMGAGGTVLLSTIIAAPIVLGLEIAALACGTLGVVGKFIGRRLAVKAKKHDGIRVLAESKLNTIADHVSRALMDGQISDQEFRLITDEVEKYSKLKSEIRAASKKAHLDEETKNSLIRQGRNEVREEFIKKLASP